MDYYILLRLTLYLMQADPVSSVERIGFLATGGLILLGLVIWAIKQNFGYFTTRLDKKDEQIARQSEERHNDILRLEGVVNAQTQVNRDLAQGVKSVADLLQSLANEVRSKK